MLKNITKDELTAGIDDVMCEVFETFIHHSEYVEVLTNEEIFFISHWQLPNNVGCYNASYFFGEKTALYSHQSLETNPETVIDYYQCDTLDEARQFVIERLNQIKL